MVTKIKVELEQNKKNYEFYKARNEQTPSQIYSKWVEIYADRVKMLERQLVKAEKLAAMPPEPVATIAPVRSLASAKIAKLSVAKSKLKKTALAKKAAKRR